MTTLETILDLEKRIGQTVLGQEKMIERMLIGLLANGNLLVEGLPGLAKTRAIKKLSKFVDAGLSRIQFTPDLCRQTSRGRIFITRRKERASSSSSPGRSSTIWCWRMKSTARRRRCRRRCWKRWQERQVTVAGKTHPLPPLFLVMATQNPIEQEGTYPLPEAQLDRFLMHVRVDYPEEKSERDIMVLVRGEEDMTAKPTEKTPVDVEKQAAVS